MKDEKHFLFFENCIIVKGVKRSLIIDVQWNRYRFVPNLFLNLIENNRNETVATIKEKYDGEYDTGIDKYIDYFLDDEWAFLTDKPAYFPKIDLTWDYPGLISNAIMDIRGKVPDYFENALYELNILGCESIEIRFFSATNLKSLLEIHKFIRKLKFTFVAVYMPFYQNLTEEIKLHAQELIRFRKFYITNAPENKVIVFNTSKTNLTTGYYSTENVQKESCGLINEAFFSPDLNHVTESQKHNTCLNRKISIDSDGEIKNCPSMSKSYGNIRNTTLREAMEKAGFQDVWHIHKDKIEVCRDCEFRHICTDCRAYVQDPNNPYSKPAKCKYDPYTATWAN